MTKWQKQSSFTTSKKRCGKKLASRFDWGGVTNPTTNLWRTTVDSERGKKSAMPKFGAMREVVMMIRPVCQKWEKKVILRLISKSSWFVCRFFFFPPKFHFDPQNPVGLTLWHCLFLYKYVQVIFRAFGGSTRAPGQLISSSSTMPLESRWWRVVFSCRWLGILAFDLEV